MPSPWGGALNNEDNMERAIDWSPFLFEAGALDVHFL
jgi:hypothetical protein